MVEINHAHRVLALKRIHSQKILLWNSFHYEKLEYLAKTGKYECIEAKLVEDNVSMALQTHIDSLPYVQIF